jgi:hypothetical protein
MKYAAELEMAFSWRQSNVRLEGRRLVIAEPKYERPSEAPDIPGFWMRLATSKPGARDARFLAARYGFLRAEGESVADWQVMIGMLERIAQPWTVATDKRHGTMPAPAIPSQLHLRAQGHAYVLRERALAAGDVVLESGTTGWRIGARTLAGFLVIQATAALAEPLPFRLCAYCGRWFAVGRSDQTYCIPRHRWQAHNQQRREQAS